MRKELMLFFSCIVMITAMMSVGNTQAREPGQKSTDQILSPLGTDSFLQSQDEVLNQINQMQQAMDRLMRTQLSQMSNNPFLVNSTGWLNNEVQGIQMEEQHHKLIYKIKKPLGADSKVKISFKEGQLIINTLVMQKTSSNEGKNKSISFSQSHYSQSVQLPPGYDPDSMELKENKSYFMVTFKKKII